MVLATEQGNYGKEITEMRIQCPFNIPALTLLHVPAEVSLGFSSPLVNRS